MVHTNNTNLASVDHLVPPRQKLKGTSSYYMTTASYEFLIGLEYYI